MGGKGKQMCPVELSALPSLRPWTNEPQSPQRPWRVPVRSGPPACEPSRAKAGAGETNAIDETAICTGAGIAAGNSAVCLPGAGRPA